MTRQREKLLEVGLAQAGPLTALCGGDYYQRGWVARIVFTNRVSNVYGIDGRVPDAQGPSRSPWMRSQFAFVQTDLDESGVFRGQASGVKLGLDFESAV